MAQYLLIEAHGTLLRAVLRPPLTESLTSLRISQKSDSCFA